MSFDFYDFMSCCRLSALHGHVIHPCWQRREVQRHLTATSCRLLCASTHAHAVVEGDGGVWLSVCFDIY